MVGGRAAELALNRINEAKDLLDKIYDMEKKSVNGASKLKKRIQAEIKFLNKGLEKGSELKEEHVLCSNLGQLGALSTVAVETSNVTGLLQTFSYGASEKIVVDVVGDQGKQWIKVILRNPKALHLLFILGGRNGVKPLDEVAEDFILCAQQHPVFYSTPKVVFWFCGGVSESLAKTLEGKGVEIKGKRIPDEDLGLPDYFGEDSGTENEDSEIESEDSEAESEDSCCDNEYTNETRECDEESEEQTKAENTVDESIIKKEIIIVDCKHYVGYTNDCDETCSKVEESKADYTEEKTNVCNQLDEGDELNFSPKQDIKSQNYADKEDWTIHKVNLDVTAMVAFVSATANGRASFIFKDKFLTEQAECERKNPVKETLHSYFKDRELLACEEAVSHFLEIVNTIGGENEKARAQELVSRLTIVPGKDYLKDKVRLGGKVRELSRIIFGTGQAHRAITITSNGGFVRSAEHQGVKLAVMYHKPRALTEAKESTAIPL